MNIIRKSDNSLRRLSTAEGNQGSKQAEVPRGDSTRKGTGAEEAKGEVVQALPEPQGESKTKTEKLAATKARISRDHVAQTVWVPMA